VLLERRRRLLRLRLRRRSCGGYGWSSSGGRLVGWPVASRRGAASSRAMQSVVERAFVRRLGALRADGRGADEARATSVVRLRNASTGAASCEVALGATVALASVAAHVVAPFADRPAEGMLRCQVSLSALGREEWDPMSRARSRAGASVAAVIEHAVLETRALDLEGLCIVAGRKVWCVSVDVSILNDAGNAADAGTLAAFSALQHFRRPDVAVIGGAVTVFDAMERAPVPLALHHAPLCVSFALFAASEAEAEAVAAGRGGPDPDRFYLLDPTDREELSADGAITVIVNAHKEVCGVHKQGWPPLDADQLKRLVQLAAARAPALAATLADAVQAPTTH
jgi:exosome complex component RRP45